MRINIIKNSLTEESPSNAPEGSAEGMAWFFASEEFDAQLFAKSLGA